MKGISAPQPDRVSIFARLLEVWAWGEGIKNGGALRLRAGGDWPKRSKIVRRGEVCTTNRSP